MEEFSKDFEVPEVNDVSVDTSAVEEPFSEVEKEPVQVESDKVIYVARKDFTARVNQDDYDFKKGVPVEVTRDIANMLLEDEDRGYTKE